MNTILPPFVDAYDVCNPDTHFIQLGGNNIALKKFITAISRQRLGNFLIRGQQCAQINLTLGH